MTPDELPRVYADTSVYGGAFDEEFKTPSRTFFDHVRSSKFQLVVSEAISNEIQGAPVTVRNLYTEMESLAEVAEGLREAVTLQRAYLRNGIVGETSMVDALHVALATVAECQVIVSWNFSHIVQFQKIPLYNKVSREEGFSEIAIHTPLGVIGDYD